MKSLMVGCGCGWAKHVAQLTTMRAVSKRRIEQASNDSGTMQHKCRHQHPQEQRNDAAFLRIYNFAIMYIC
jgi:hypothetical protein